MHHYPSALVIRTGALLHSWENKDGGRDTLSNALRLPHVERMPFAQLPVLTYVPDLVPTCLDLLIDGERGLWHLANSSTSTKKDEMETQAKRGGLEGVYATKKTLQTDKDEASHRLGRGFVSERGQLLPSLEDALMRYHRERTQAEKISQSA